ncbi:hypothetical protein K469DRAFT_682619 [Zopfia rhizophila CBS 207.26]|uniref:Heterokaryon incompatibility domain-containing protein n=1 Tax=Zopfia rhizophila CBS 207.26 TaxID=1314779 RepID=A0A6A6DFC9_9PEZI|nr:hypothetical protein K469DRAFT_682619 [Zopfia rhizophila CBS 207.26]
MLFNALKATKNKLSHQPTEPPVPVLPRKSNADHAVVSNGSEIPVTVVEAKEHIASIRAKKRALKTYDGTTTDVDAALVVLSDDLYKKSTHFLLELLQNADDNSYQVSSPTMNMTFKAHTFRIDCNEVGFSKKNVEAICSIGKSSKGTQKTACIGEKGIGEKDIGFKSVFKVADTVWISSGPYSFKFDRNEALGMITPLWEEFPSDVLPEFTSILLQLSPDCDVQALVQEMKTFDMKLMLFLKNIEEINIKIHDQEGTAWITRLSHKHTWKTKLASQPLTSGEKEPRITMLKQNNISTPYTLFRHPVLQLPSEVKRVGITQSDILLAFPSNPVDEVRGESHNVYAFLPIRDFGLKFILQADFILTANREDIDSFSAWNATLLDHVPHALLSAINNFNSTELRYSWLQYLLLNTNIGDFFQELPARMRDVVSQQPVLESLNGEFKKPSELILIPEELADDNREPLIPSTNECNYLSHKYPSEDMDDLKWLGVQIISEEIFLNHLCDFVSNQPGTFQKMPHKWHSRLSTILGIMILKNDDFKSIIGGLQIVPLRNGEWISASRGSLTFSLKSGNSMIPKGIEVFEVHADAERDSHRRNFLTILGARKPDPAGICDFIFQTHISEEFRPENLDNADLISHIEFLYRAGWKDSGAHLWFVAKNGSHHRGSEMYVDSEVPYSASIMFKEQRQSFPFLHGDYWNQSRSPDDLREWLVRRLGVAVIPRLVVEGKAKEPSFTMSKDFEFVIHNHTSSEALLLLKQHWKYYSKWIVDGSSEAQNDAKKLTPWQQSQKKLREKLSSIKVACRAGCTARLGQTFLPRRQLLRCVSGPTPAPENMSRLLAGHSGVVTNPGVEDLINHLHHLSTTQASTEYVSEIYNEIQAYHSDTSLGLIRRSFKETKLIHVDRETGDSWIDPETCVWTGPDCLRRIPCLQKHYPKLRNFFCDTLGLRDANLETFLAEARLIEGTDPLKHIREVFLAIGIFLKDEKTTTTVDFQLVEHTIFPVLTGIFDSNVVTLRNALANDEGYIADRHNLAQSFKGSLDLLAFDLETVEKIKPLINKLELEDRLLSKAAESWTTAEGRIKPDDQYTAYLRGKARFIACLIPDSNPNKKQLVKNLHHIMVHRSETVTIHWSIPSRDGRPTIQGRPESGTVSWTLEGEDLKLYFASTDEDAELLPLDLAQVLSEFCKITDAEQMMLLAYILTQRDVGRISKLLRKHGIHSEAEWNSMELVPFPSQFPDEMGNVRDCSYFPTHRNFNSMSNGLFSWSTPRLLFSTMDEETIFIGELYTSPRRTTAGHRPFERAWKDLNSSTFTIRDGNDLLIDFLARRGHQLGPVAKNPLIHMEVCVSTGDLHSAFELDFHQANKAKMLTSQENRTLSTEIFILVRVYDVYLRPGIAWFIDPWRLHVNGSLSLEIDGGYHARLFKNAPAIFPHEGINEDRAEKRAGLYNYEPLKNPREIRVLKIWPGKGNSALEGSIRHISLDSKVQFWAISYVWGAAPTSVALFTLKTPEGIIPITASLHFALKCFRERYSSMYFWADAVCINQADTLEKKIQIRLLQTIFQSAERVMAWVGNEGDNSHHAIETLAQIRSRSVDSNSNCVPQILAQLPITANSNHSHRPANDIWVDIDTLLQRNWFRRVWIVQELVLPSKILVVCGRSELDWDYFYEALTICEDWLNQRLDCKSRGVRILQYAGPALALGLTRRKLREESRKGFVQKGQVMELLYHAGKSKSYPFCSWIPFWTREEYPQSISRWAAANGTFFAGRRIPPDVHLGGRDLSTLRIKGFIVDKIVSKSNFRIGTSYSVTFGTAMVDIRSLISCLKDYPTGETLEDLMLKLPIGNAKRPHLDSTIDRLESNRAFMKPDEDWPKDLHEEILSVKLDQDSSKFDEKPPGAQEMISKYWQTAAAFPVGSRRACFASLQEEVGDEICIFHGGLVPFLLRKPSDETNESHNVMGEAYIHGIMYGEALRFEGIREQEFHLV